MNILLLTGAALSLLYFIIIAIYTGMGSSFGYIWLFISIVLLLFWGLRRFHLIHPVRYRMPLWLKVGLITTVMLAACLFLFLEGLILHNMFIPYPNDLDYVIVLGARVDGERVTKSLAQRLDKALEYTEENENVMIVVSGGQGPGEDISEAEAMERYLTDRGVDPGQIIQEAHSRNTTENLRNSFSYIVVNWSAREESLKGQNPKVGIISNSFHIFRARAIARQQGFSNISGIPAPSDPILLPSQMFREFFALIKDWLVGNI